jgi:hypothetical protein
METVVVSLIIITLVLYGAMTLARHYFDSQDMMASSWRAMTERNRERATSDFRVIGAQAQDDAVDIDVRNTGSTRLADFEQCDLVIHYYDTAAAYQIAWLPYESIAEGIERWEVLGIYSDADSLTPAVYEPGIVNPTEEVSLRATLPSPVQPSSTLMAVFTTPSGAGASTTFTSN